MGLLFMLDLLWRMTGRTCGYPTIVIKLKIAQAHGIAVTTFVRRSNQVHLRSLGRNHVVITAVKRIRQYGQRSQSATLGVFDSWYYGLAVMLTGLLYGYMGDQVKSLLFFFFVLGLRKAFLEQLA